jgi:hypothetical protein
MNMKQLAVTGGALSLLASTSAWGAVISVNYDVAGANTPSLAASDIAGAVPAANWNNVQATAVGQPFNYGMTYVDDSGANTSLIVVASSGNADTWNTAGTPDEIIFGDKSAWAGGAQTLTFSSIPYVSYDVYIYVSFWTNEVVNFDIGGNAQTVTNTFTPQFTPGPDFVQNDTYVKYTGLSGDIVVTMQPTSGELHLGGFQIVQVPEPSILGLLALAPAMALRRRRA